ncbi:uncharacterized protein LOC143038542 isoform X2 [Oratosquilla oratoria]|uniref:uncharacterized protein LOC143038542 isoform X2 n=1 Tax=Oratosquilla oratoria TaxID=337810 RepID=UPI003F757320
MNNISNKRGSSMALTSTPWRPANNTRHNSGNYTSDIFRCGICCEEMCDIDTYVNHMVLQEKCVLCLCPSTKLTDLLLPRFVKRLGPSTNDEENDVKRIPEIVDKVLQNELTSELEDLDKVIEVETGLGRRWKCQLCGLTFSRQAAIANHFKVHHQYNHDLFAEEISTSSVIKQEIGSRSPVKHIVAVNSKVELDHLAEALSYSEKIWNKPVCHVCGQTFKTGKILRTHIAIVHCEDKPFRCHLQGCTHAFKTKGSLKRHQRRHTDERPFECMDCGRCFRESGSLLRHQQSRTSCVLKKDSQLPLYGRTMPVAVDEKISLNSLKKEIHPAGIHQEHDIYSNQEESKQSVRALISAAKTPGIKFIKQEEVNFHHLKREVVESQSSYGTGTDVALTPDKAAIMGLKGIVCKKETPFSMLGPTLEEEAIDGDIQENETDSMDVKPPSELDTLNTSIPFPSVLQKSFSCPVCDTHYPRRSSLRLHMKIHKNELDGKCHMCKKEFSTRQALIRHLASHSSIRSFICKECGKAFKLMSHAQAHLKTHSAIKTVPCQYCGRLFKSVSDKNFLHHFFIQSSRNVHERIHSNDRNFVCSHCEKTFTTKASLVRHLRTHTGETPFACPYCGQNFKEHGTLSRHLKKKIPCAQQAQIDAESGGDRGIRVFRSKKFQESQEIKPTKDEDQLLQRLTDTPMGSNDSLQYKREMSSSSSIIPEMTEEDSREMMEVLVYSDESVQSSQQNFNIEEGKKKNTQLENIVMQELVSSDRASYIVISEQPQLSIAPLHPQGFLPE